MGLKLKEQEEIFSLAEQLTGSCQQGSFRKEVLLSNVERRMIHLGVSDFRKYLRLTEENTTEKAEFISALTIHTTEWFRELPHFEILKGTLESRLQDPAEKKMNFWVAAASTGEEVWSMGMILEEIRGRYSQFEYEILASDIDPISLEKGKRGIYPQSVRDSLPPKYRSFLLVGSGRTQGWVAVSPEIRKRCSFVVNDLTRIETSISLKKFDFIFCRNVLIYFTPEQTKKIISDLAMVLEQQGMLCLGHSEAIVPSDHKLISINSTFYQRPSLAPNMVPSTEHSSKILIIDDNEVIRIVLKKILSFGNVKIFEASSGAEANELCKVHQFDLVTLDLSMPGQHGLEWLVEFRSLGGECPVVIVSGTQGNDASEVLAALQIGAQDYIVKDKLHPEPFAIRKQLHSIMSAYKIKKNNSMGGSHPGHRMSVQDQNKSNQVPNFKAELIIIGASTGGPEALRNILQGLPPHSPPIVIAQHITPHFGKAFAESLALVSGLQLGPPIDGDLLERNHLYIAQGDFHVELNWNTSKSRPQIFYSTKDPIQGHRPSVDHMFESASSLPLRILGIQLTGMGADGARGLKTLKNNLGKNLLAIGQSEESCVVYGMPREAKALGAIDYELNLTDIRRVLLKAF